jgi:hypothetical protein
MPDRSAAQFARVMRRVITAYPRARRIHLVLDNLNIHCEKSLIGHFGRRMGRRLWRRVTVHFTPEHGSWLNQAELELGLVSRSCLGRRRIPDLKHQSPVVRAWNTRANRARTRIQWRFTRKDARRKFGCLSKRSKT